MILVEMVVESDYSQKAQVELEEMELTGQQVRAVRAELMAAVAHREGSHSMLLKAVAVLSELSGAKARFIQRLETGWSNEILYCR